MQPTFESAFLIEPVSSAATDEIARKMRETVRGTANRKITGGRVYYISEHGSDSDSGLSPEHAWHSIDKLNNAVLATGDNVLFERGSVFHGQLHAKSGVYYGAFGEGCKPCIYGSKYNMAELTWEKAGDGIWKCSAYGFTDIGNIVFDGGRHIGRRVFEPTFTQELDFYHDKENKLLILYCKKGAPNEIFGEIESGDRPSVISVGQEEDITLENLCVKYGGGHGISGFGNRNITVRSCEVGWIGGSILSGSTRYGNGIEIWGSCDGLLIENCYVYQCYDTGISHQGRNGGDFKNIVYRNNLVELCTWAVEYWLADDDMMMDGVLIVNNLLRFAGFGFCRQRRFTDVGALIKSWEHTNRAKNFTIRNNILDRAVYKLFDISCKGRNSEYLPKMIGNTYIQKRNSQGFGWNGSEFMFDNNIAGRILSDVDEKATVLFSE